MLAGFGRFLVLAILVLGGALLGPSPAGGALLGALIAGAVLLIETLVGRAAPRNVLSASFGLLVGLTLAVLAGMALAPMETTTGTMVRLGLAVGLGWIGLATGARRSDSFSLSRLRSDWDAQADNASVASTPKILDTSVIIDGRIAEKAEAGFMK